MKIHCTLLTRVCEQLTQNMVTLYGAGERTGILNVEAKLGKALGKMSSPPVDLSEKRLYHISTKKLDNLSFKPRVPENFLTKEGYEDSSTPRISFANNIDDALKAMSSDLKGKELYVYAAPRQTKFLSPTIKQVPDVEITSEKWVLEPTDVEYVGKIKVGEAIEKPYIYKYGNKTAELYGWEWKQIIEDGPSILVVKAAERDAVLSEISARMARYQDLDPEMYSELKALRQDVKEIFNKGLSPGAEIMEQLYFLDSKTMDFVEKLSRDYNEVVTPDDFQSVAKIMSENLRSRVPILKSFTKYLGRLAEDFLLNAKPSDSAIDSEALLKTLILGAHKGGKPLPKWLTRILGIKNESIREKFLRRIPGYVPDSFTDQLLTGVRPPTRRRTGFKIGKYSIFSEDITKGVEIGLANKLDKTWTNVPWVNFDGVTLEQNFTQTFEEKLAYKDADGNWINNIIQVDQKTSPNWWEEFRNKDNKINDIADVNKARTAFGVNGNHSNDAVIVKRFHLWGRKNNIQTSTVHDAFFTNVSDMLAGRRALREIYANAIENNSIEATLLEMRKRGLPKELYEKYLEEAKDIGLIPVVGRSVIDGKLMTEADILKKADILASVPERFKDNRYFYGIG